MHDFVWHTSASIAIILSILVIVLQQCVADPELLPPSFDYKSLTKRHSSRDSPLLRSRKRILPMAFMSAIGVGNSKESATTSETIPLVPFSMIRDQIPDQDFITDRVKMNLECRPKSMLLNMTFADSFRGVVSVGKSTYTLLEQSEECSLRGDGRQQYSLQIFHNRCLTKFDKKRGHFINHLFVRYHPTLETGGDYSKTLVCKFGLMDLSVN